MSNCLDRFYRFAVKVMGVEDAGEIGSVALRGIEKLEDFFIEIGMPVSFEMLGITPTQAEMENMARKCAEATGGKKGSALVLTEPDMLKIYQMANER